jgi:hypothetical protein
MKSIDHLSWPVYSFALLFLCSFFQIMQWPFLPRFLDIYYHLSVMKGFADAGGYVTRAFWEYAPAGRPHLYPPVLHVGMLLLYKTGFSPMTVGRLVDCISYPLFLLSFYWAVRQSYTERVAFLSLLLLSSIFSLALASVTLSAFNLSVIFGLWTLGCVEKRKSLAAGVCLSLCFYTHLLAAALVFLTLVFYSLLRREITPVIVKVVAMALLLAAPFLFYQFHYRGYFSFVKVHELTQWEFDATVDALALCGFVYFLRKKFLKSITLPLALTAGFFPLVITHPTRFFNGHGLVGPSILAALFLDELLRSWQTKLSSGKLLLGFAIFVSFVLFAGPFFEWDVSEKKGRWVWGDRTIARYLLPDEKRNFRAKGFSIFFQEDYAKIVRTIRANSGPDDILWTDFSYTAGILGILADRATSCAMLAEVRPYEQADRLKDARIIVWFKDKDAKPAFEMTQAVRGHHWKLLEETDMAFVYQNSESSSKRVVPKAIVPTPMLYGILGALVSILLYDLKRQRL